MRAEVYEVIIVGAGAAGLMAAIECGRTLERVLVLNGGQKIGAKILVSGGTRCNVTNVRVSEKNYHSGDFRLLRNILRAFSPEKTVEFFSSIGAELEAEEGGKIFPKTQSAKTVLEALAREARQKGAVIETGKKVTRISRDGGGFSVGGEGFEFRSRAVILCTGGLSYPATGSDGSGFALASALGHSVIPTHPALTPLWTADAGWRALSGISLPCRLTLWEEKEPVVSYEAPILFTHTGFSGPCVLNISRHWIARAKKGGLELTANFLPSLKRADFEKRLSEARQKHPRKTLGAFLTEFFPQRLAEMLLKKNGIPSCLLNQLAGENQRKMTDVFYGCPLPVTGAAGYDKAEVTAGGISLEEIDPRTLESKIVPGLFFAGEILDVDGEIGGYNFQWAWSSGVAAGKAASKGAA